METLVFASKLEVVQLVSALVAVGFGFWRLWIAIENGLATTGTDANDLRRVVAETQFLGEMFRLFTLGCIVALGVISVLLPPPYDDIALGPAVDTLQSMLTRMGLITITLVMVLDSLMQEYRRQKFMSNVKMSLARLLRRSTDRS